MNRQHSLLLRLMALLAMAAFVALFSLSVVAFVAQRQFLRAAPVLAALQEVGAYERAPGILADLLISSTGAPRSGLAQLIPIPELNKADTERFLATLLPQTWLQAQSEMVVQRAMAGLNGQPPPTPAVISLVEVKAQLQGAAGREAVLAAIEARPACGPMDLSAFTCGFNLAGDIACRPPALNLDICGTAIDLALVGLTAQVPDQVDLDVVLRFSEPLSGPLRDHARRYATAIRLLGTFGWLAALPFFLLGSLLAVRSLSGLLRWWGAPLAGVGLTLLPVIALTALWPTWYVAAPMQHLSAGAPSLAGLLADVAAVLGRGLALQLGLIAFVFLLLGVGMLALSYIAPWLQRWLNQG